MEGNYKFEKGGIKMTEIENYLFDNNTLLYFHYRWLLEKVCSIQQLYKYSRPDLQTGKLNAWGETIQEIEKTAQTALREQQEITDRYNVPHVEWLRQWEKEEQDFMGLNNEKH